MGQHIHNEGGDLFHLCGKYHPRGLARGRLTDRHTDRQTSRTQTDTCGSLTKEWKLKGKKGFWRGHLDSPPFDHLHLHFHQGVHLDQIYRCTKQLINLTMTRDKDAKIAALSRAREWRDERRSQAATVPVRNGPPKPLMKTSTRYPSSRKPSSSNQRSSNKTIETASRKNDATRASFSDNALANPFEKGSFRYVAKGKYIKGPRAGEPCVCKWFISGHVDQATFFDLDIKAMYKAYEIVKEWNNRRMIDKHVKVNIPEVWTGEMQAGSSIAGKKLLIEPFILNPKVQL